MAQNVGHINPVIRACPTLCRETCICSRKTAPGGGFCVSLPGI